MRYLPLLMIILFAGTSVNGQNKWNKRIAVKKVDVTVEVKDLLASTTYEFEFANQQNMVVEGLYNFKLLPEQIVSAMQLELDGKFRDATIEEKWKANAAYTEIVGKRIDPALLIKDYNNEYYLNIYPMPANGIRKVRITIDEILSIKEGKISYSLPIPVTDIVQTAIINLDIKNGTDIIFSPEYTLNAQQQIIKHESSFIGENIFSMRVAELSFFTDESGAIGRLVRRQQPAVLDGIKKLLVLWDVSASMKFRNLDKEIAYLQKFIKLHKPEMVQFVIFSDEVNEQKIFDEPDSKEKDIEKYLRQLTYDGATSYKALNQFGTDADYTLLFSDGQVSLENNIKPYHGPIRAVTSSYSNVENLKMFTSLTQNAVINISSGNIDSMMKKHAIHYPTLRLPDNYEVKTVINEVVYFEVEKNSLTGHQNNLILYDKKLVKKFNTIVALNILQKKAWHYQELLRFGIEFRVVTPHTAFIVLERLEDYIKYDIAVPPDMYEAAAKANYANTQHKYMLVEEGEKLKRFNILIEAFNKRYKKALQPVEELPALFKSNTIGQSAPVTDRHAAVVLRGLSGRLAGIVVNNVLDESVVLTSRNSSVMSVVLSRQKDEYVFTSAQTVEQVLQGRVAGLQITGAGTGFLNNAVVSIRGSHIAPLWVLDNIPIDGNINDYVIVSDIDYIQVQNAASDMGRWGSRAAGGVILVFTKKGKVNNNFNTRPYRLSDMEDVAYIQELKASDDKIETYKRLKNTHYSDVSFFIDVADYFNSIGLKKEARKIVLNAIEAGNNQSAKASVAQTFDSWGDFGKAIELYEQLREPGVHIKRQLAWSYYRNGNADTAIKILYALMTDESTAAERMENKVVFLQDMVGMMNKNTQKDNAFPGLNAADTMADIRVVITTNEPIEFVSVRTPGMNKFKKTEDLPNSRYQAEGFVCDYIIPKATKGRYRFRIKTAYYGYFYNYDRPDIAPKIVQVLIFRNYGKPEQTIEQQNIIIDNQEGEFEILGFKWPE